MILALLAGLAWAGDPVWVDGHGTVLIDTQPAVTPGLGGGIGVGRAPVLVELRTDVSAAPQGPRWALWPALRLHLVDLERDRAWRPSVTAGLGLQVGAPAGARRLIVGGLDLDAPKPISPFRSDRLRPRVGAWVESPLDGSVRVGIKLGVVGQAGGRKAPETEPEPETETDPPLLADGDAGASPDDPEGGPSTDAADTPGPWWDPKACEWVDADPGNGWRPEDGAGLGSSEAGGAGGESPDGAQGTQRQGWLVVVAAPGTLVRLPGMDNTVGPEGGVRLAAPEGVVDVEVIGGGRSQTFEAAIADGFVLWLRAEPPTEVAVQFDSGSAAVDAADRVAAQALARNRGQFHLQLTGSFSPEGNRAQNLDLATRRAQAVADLLVEVGVPREHIQVLPPTPPRQGLTTAQQRAVYILPVPPPEGS